MVRSLHGLTLLCSQVRSEYISHNGLLRYAGSIPTVGTIINQNQISALRNTVKRIDMRLQEIATLVNGNLTKTFDYEVSAKKSFYAVEIEQAPSAAVMKVIYNNGMRVSYDMYASAERGRYMMYVINYKRVSDYEWVD